ncbi:MAG: DNA topoisomerase VI subunit B [Planctomycetes bacterium]|nr:DNA topoisomerase VI subunit B [Planctomycetota bacterium]
MTAETMARQQRDISVSEFFAKNRHLLGFDNKRKALLMSVKEAVDNSLDACEEAGILPEIEVRLVQTGEDRFRVLVRDNGPGIVKQQIPNVFGKLLYGSKFHRLKMSRGQQGIGISAAGMYGLLTTGKSIRIVSRISPKKAAHHYEIQIDTKTNSPNVVKDAEVEVAWEHGTEVEIELAASYNKGRQSVDEYMEQTAIANPHGRFAYFPPVGEPVMYERGTEVMPAQTDAIKPHPLGVELGMLIKMLHETKSHWLTGFMQTEFCRVGPKVAEEICRRAKLNPRAHPKRIARQEAEKLYKAIQEARLMSPPTNCLAPIGAEQILTGLLKGVKAEFFTASTRPPAVYRGNPFQIEAGLAFGGALGPDPKANEDEPPPEQNGKGRNKNGNGSGGHVPLARIIRFANRVPLLYQQSACCIFKTVIDLEWRRYGLSQSGGSLPQGPVVVMVHMASVWVPFTSESKEAIADYDEIRQEIKLALQDCGRKLSAYLNRRRKMKYQGERRSIFARYIPEVVAACSAINPKIDRASLLTNLSAMATRITAQADEQLDEHGRPIKSIAGMQTDDELGPNVIVVDPDAQDAAAPPSAPPGTLFSQAS